MDEELDERINFLRTAKIDTTAHSGRGLLDHLLGTGALLLEWNARPALCDDGLFHSVYGTEHFLPATVPLGMRAEVQELIGAEAEELAWFFCVMERAAQHAPSGRTFYSGHFLAERRDKTPLRSPVQTAPNAPRCEDPGWLPDRIRP